MSLRGGILLGMANRRTFNPLVAGVLSFFVPGLGQLYKGQWIAAILWFCVTAAGYWFFVIPGVVLHIVCIITAMVRK